MRRADQPVLGAELAARIAADPRDRIVQRRVLEAGDDRFQLGAISRQLRSVTLLEAPLPFLHCREHRRADLRIADGGVHIAVAFERAEVGGRRMASTKCIQLLRRPGAVVVDCAQALDVRERLAQRRSVHDERGGRVAEEHEGLVAFQLADALGDDAAHQRAGESMARLPQRRGAGEDRVSQHDARVGAVLEGDDVHRGLAAAKARGDEGRDGGQVARPDRNGDEVRLRDRRGHRLDVRGAQRADAGNLLVAVLAAVGEADDIAADAREVIGDRVAANEDELVAGSVQELPDEAAADPSWSEDDRLHADLAFATGAARSSSRPPIILPAIASLAVA